LRDSWCKPRHLQLAINAETLFNAEEMLDKAEAAQAAGLGKTPADAPRARTEVDLRRQERIDLEGEAAVVSARLAELLLLQSTVDLKPAELTVVPVTLVPENLPLDSLVTTGLLNRPELAESRALVEAALARRRQSRLSPLLPRLEIGYIAGDFGGGQDQTMSNFGARADGTAQAVWELRNLGLSDAARVRERQSQLNQASYHVLEVQARVGAEVTAAAKLARAHMRTLASAQHGIRQALETWRRLREAAFGMAGPRRQFDPLEPLLAEQALAQVRKRYLGEVIDYNKAQFRLYTAMGQPPMCALPGAVPMPLKLSTIPSEPIIPDEQVPSPANPRK
jgi:hypothetical protein